MRSINDVMTAPHIPHQAGTANNITSGLPALFFGEGAGSSAAATRAAAYNALTATGTPISIRGPATGESCHLMVDRVGVAFGTGLSFVGVGTANQVFYTLS